jgi:hypothetical protein
MRFDGENVQQMNPSSLKKVCHNQCPKILTPLSIFCYPAPKLEKGDFGRATVETTTDGETYSHEMSAKHFNTKTLNTFCKSLNYAAGVKYPSTSSSAAGSSPTPRISFDCTNTEGGCQPSIILETTSDVAGAFCYSETGKHNRLCLNKIPLC